MQLFHTNRLLSKVLVPVAQCISDVGEGKGKPVSSYLEGLNNSLRLLASAVNYVNPLRHGSINVTRFAEQGSWGDPCSALRGCLHQGLSPMARPPDGPFSLHNQGQGPFLGLFRPKATPGEGGTAIQDLHPSNKWIHAVVHGKILEFPHPPTQMVLPRPFDLSVTDRSALNSVMPVE
ncbi:hypothetical protein E2C01_038433 [Portunus trituberculatus]|uniref:Uncharacterized protein n=1 Tax=Portunus trituberculatus TaxID=210409 RepID=A0A5B7FK46_PORTR|nr:hypothetical protein [Portunus trituberculatus]